MAEYLLKLQLIVRNSEFKDKELADKYETAESKMNGEAYTNAVLKTDAFESYQYDGREVYKLLAERGYDEDRIFIMMKNPLMIPLDVREILLENARAAFIESYVEPNKYYMKQEVTDKYIQTMSVEHSKEESVEEPEEELWR